MPTELITSPEHDRKRSLGWLGVQWMEHFVIHGPGDIQGQSMLHPQIDPDGVPLSDELVRLTVDCYALDGQGQRLYDSVFFSRAKGADKSGHASRIGLFEALGPCRFAGFAEGTRVFDWGKSKGEVFQWLDFEYEYQPGEPMGRPITYPFLRLLATEEEQTGNVYDAMHFNLTEGPLQQAFHRQTDVGLTRVYLPGGGEIRPSTAGSASKDGGKETWANFDETHLYTSAELRSVYNTVRRNLTKRKDAEPWSFESSTMYEPGKNSVAETSHDVAKRIKEGKARRTRFYFNHREAWPDTDPSDEDSLRRGLIEAYGDAASYIPIERKISEAWDTRNTPEDTRRYMLNQVTAHADAWLAPHEWDSCAVADELKDGDMVTLGFDGGESNDNTALVACRVNDMFLQPLGIWEPEDGEAPRAKVDGMVRWAFEHFDVVGMYADVYLWEDHLLRWASDLTRNICVKSWGKNPIAWDMRSKKKETTFAVEAFHRSVVGRDLCHNGSVALGQHVKNARRMPNQFGDTITKESRESKRKIDGAMAAILARQCCQDYHLLPDNKKRRVRTGKAVFL